MEKREPFSTAGGNVHWFSSYGKQYGGCSNIKKNNYHEIKQSTSGYLFMYYVLTADNSSNPCRHTHKNLYTWTKRHTRSWGPWIQKHQTGLSHRLIPGSCMYDPGLLAHSCLKGPPLLGALWAVPGPGTWSPAEPHILSWGPQVHCRLPPWSR